ncbi:protealysin inhibitor emfourin [Streptantibioticus silvisoli]|uniref:Metalloprotease n=1 Tax=Streptantibioticus silvisoli TaxID=2705255 RepID=A0ABT6VVF4_9ACTN|nr:protealysin inhibitor emfourin [Streptantibioticus silvisoli]MDI5961443.1 hypothetical protein [Streptantibioticus silvisoli]
MRITVTRTGGLTGRTVSAALDTEGHPDADRLHSLARAALTPGTDARGGGAGARAGGVPDGYRYEITADGRTARCADPRLTAAQRELIRLVLERGT